MAQSLRFKLGGAEYEAAPVKIERKKLYGRVDTEATDASGAVCTAVRLDPDGDLIIPAGALKQALLDEDGQWVERAELKPVDAEGNEVPVVPSSFDGVIELSTKVSAEAFLDHVWKSVYQLDEPSLAAALGDDIYAFPFNYRAAPGADEGYLLASDGTAFLFLGEKSEFAYIGIEEEAVLDEEVEETTEDEDDFDFSMM